MLLLKIPIANAQGGDFRGSILVKAVGFAEAMLRKPLPFFEHDVNPKTDCEAPQLTGAIVSKKDYEKAHLKGQGVIVYEYRYGFLEIYLPDVTSTDTESSHKDVKDLIVRFLAGPSFFRSPFKETRLPSLPFSNL